VHYSKTNNINIKGIIINKFQQDTNNPASKNFINELSMYTDTKILGTVKELEEINPKSILKEFDKFKFI
ncbi:MAG: hypothetical protein LUG16_03520, partial [Candidatus Gastranaerophilales bacterium]|nr:hypothetical protein [Candidatus Gastranaerophilales bacterium]